MQKINVLRMNVCYAEIFDKNLVLFGAPTLITSKFLESFFPQKIIWWEEIGIVPLNFSYATH